MCYHLYTGHLCGHRTVSLGQCEFAVMPTQVLFCDNYHYRKSSSLKLCGGHYCKEDKGIAYWVENGRALVAACDDKLSDLKRRRSELYSKLESFRQYKDAWGPLTDKLLSDSKPVHDEYEALPQAMQTVKDRKHFIIDGMKKTKSKMQATNQRLVATIRQAQAARAARMNPAQRPPVAPTPQPTQMWNQPAPFSTPCPSVPAGHQQTVPTPSRTNVSAQLAFSPPLVTPAVPAASPEPTPETKVPPPKKRRGRPPKSKQAEESAPLPQSLATSPIRKSSGRTTHAAVADLEGSKPKRQFTHVTSKIDSKIPDRPSSGARRSGRIKQQVSYAESPTPSPERLPDNDSVLNTNSASVKQAKRKSTRARTSTANKKKSQEDWYQADDHDDVDSEGDDGEGDDGEWQDQEEEGVESAATLAKSLHSSKKRRATSPPQDSRLSKRQAAKAQDNPRPQEEPHSQIVDDDFTIPDLQTALAKTPTSAHDSQAFSSWNKHDSFPHDDIQPSSNMAMPVQASLRGGSGSPLTPKYSYKATPATSFTSNPAIGRVALDTMDIQRQSDIINGLGVDDDILMPLYGFEDDNDYDFDVGAMSQHVANIDAQKI